jgi:hypothetical protein
MAKFYGVIGYGFSHEVESQPGVWTNEITERNFVGDLIKFSSKNEKTNSANDNISIHNQVSMIADPYAIQNFKYIKFVRFMGTAWKVTDAEVQYPNLILTLGGEYNGE